MKEIYEKEYSEGLIYDNAFKTLIYSRLSAMYDFYNLIANYDDATMLPAASGTLKNYKKGLVTMMNLYLLLSFPSNNQKLNKTIYDNLITTSIRLEAITKEFSADLIDQSTEMINLLLDIEEDERSL